MNEPIRIGNQKQLFLDSFLIEWCDKVRRRVCPVTKHPENPVIRPVADWEPSGYIVYGLSDRSPFIPVGGVGTWDRFNNSLANNPPIRVGDELRFYYGGRNYLHSGLYKGPDGGPAAGDFRAGVGLGLRPTGSRHNQT